MKNLSLLTLLLLSASLFAAPNFPPPTQAPDFTVTTSDGQVKKLYQDYISQQKLVVIEAFFTTCPPCATHAPLFQNLYTSMNAAHPGQVEFLLLSTLITDTNAKVAQYKTNKGLTMPGVGKDGGSITALQPYLNGQFGAFQGTPTFIVIAPGSGAVTFDLRGNTPSQTIALLQQKIESFFPKPCSLTDPFGAALDQVEIKVDAPTFDTTFVANGEYETAQVASLKNSTYTLKPYKSGNSSVGLTTYDLVLISKHILAIEPFQCPWQIVAADVNCTGTITTFDIVTMRKSILGIIDSLPCGAWRFMPDSASISNGACQDFVGVKLGDVNAGSCTDSLLMAPEDRTLPQKLLFEDLHFQPGETASISLFFATDVTLEGLQFALEFDPSTLIINQIESNNLEGFDADSYHLSDKNLAISWLQASGQAVAAQTNLLTLEITAPKGGKLSELIGCSKLRLAPEAYGANGQISPLQFSFSPRASAYCISPNPTPQHFSIQANTEEAGDFSVQMLDFQGKIVFETIFAGLKGLNHWDIQAGDYPSGIYALKVNGTAIGKVVLER